MALYNTAKRWGLVSQSFHWIIAFLIFLAIILGVVADSLPVSNEKLKVFIFHKSLGITVLVLALLRLLWKLLTLQPQMASGIPAKDHGKVALGHGALYLLMLALPLSGWVLNSAANFPFQWMNLFSVPAIPGIPASWQNPFVLIHVLLAIVFGLMLVGHIVMACYHHRHHSDALSRMLPNSHYRYWSGLGVMAMALVVFISAQSFFQAKTPDAATPATASRPSTSEAGVVDGQAHTAKQWRVIADKSRLAFVGRYDGVAFTGEFSRFEASMYFDAEAPAAGFFDVLIDTASVTTSNADWDSALPGEEWFFVASYPTARYQTTAIKSLGDAYRAEGVLSLKGIGQAVPLDFEWRQRPSGQVDFSASAVVNRSDFAIGTGPWAAGDTIGLTVEIAISLVLEAVEPEHRSGH
ncbi:MAG: YceI family protein [Cellvibrionaceae bacterium]|nr:YceI family protein [Cellvibrionaceae bacterium]